MIAIPWQLGAASLGSFSCAASIASPWKSGWPSTNMSSEFGSKMGIMNPDETTFDYLRVVVNVCQDFGFAVADWQSLVSDNDATYDKVITIDISQLAPMVTWGTNRYGSRRGNSLPRNSGYEWCTGLCLHGSPTRSKGFRHRVKAISLSDAVPMPDSAICSWLPVS